MKILRFPNVKNKNQDERKQGNTDIDTNNTDFHRFYLSVEILTIPSSNKLHQSLN
jgi:hypothetical protein